MENSDGRFVNVFQKSLPLLCFHASCYGAIQAAAGAITVFNSSNSGTKKVPLCLAEELTIDSN